MAAGAVFILILSGSCGRMPGCFPAKPLPGMCAVRRREYDRPGAECPAQDPGGAAGTHSLYSHSGKPCHAAAHHSVPGADHPAGASPRREILPVLRERCPDQPGEKLEWAAETADTIGQALALLADESMQKHAQLAQRMLELLCNGSEYDLLTAVGPVSRKREDLLEVCTQLRQLATAELTRAASGGESRFSTRRITRMLEALDDLLPVCSKTAIPPSALHPAGPASVPGVMPGQGTESI